jgi:thiol-disulfide isomerase/thioredoxin
MQNILLYILSFLIPLINFEFNSIQIDESNDTIKTVVNDIVNNYKNKSSISYNVQYKKKYYSEIDTILIKGNCQLFRITEDSILGGQFWFNTNKEYETFYNSNTTYIVKHDKKTILILDPKNGYSLVKGNIFKSIINIYFFEFNKLINFINNKTNKVFVSMDTILKKEYWKLHVIEPDRNQTSDINKIFWINKKENTIDKIIHTYKSEGEYQFEEWVLSDIKFDYVRIDRLSYRIDSLMQIYKVTNSENIVASKRDLLKVETLAPTFSCSKFSEEVNIDFHGKKLYLLDFWYLSCYPCIQAIPHLVNLYNEFAAKGLEIYGLNPYDDKIKKRDILLKFINERKISYPIVFIDKRIPDSLYNVSGYPTFYLIDRNGEILYSNVGFSTSVIDTLRSIIETELKK